MKNLIIGLVVAVVGVSVTNAAVFQPSVTISASSSISYTTTIDKFLDAYIANHTNAQLQTKFSDVEDAITQILKTRILSDRAIFILEYIRFRVRDWLEINDEDEDEDDTEDEDSDQEGMIDVDDYEAGVKMIVAGEESIPVAEFELVARFEKINIEQFSIISTSSDFDESIQYVRVYNEEGELVATQSPDGTTATFNDPDLTLDLGTNIFYVTLQPYAIGGTIDAPQTSTFTLKWRTDEAVGVTSNNNVEGSTIHDTVNVITIAPIGISSIQLLNSYAGYHVDEQLFNNVEADLAIVRINFAEGFSFDTNSSQDLEAILETLTVRVVDGTVAGNIAGTLEVQRIDSLSTTVDGEVDGELVSFDLTQFINDKNVIDAGDSIVLIVRGTPSLTASESESVTIEFDNSYAAVLEYTTTDNNGPTLSSAAMLPEFIGSVNIDD